LTNFDTSTLWVRDRRQLTDALDTTTEFLRTKQSDAGTVIDYRNWHLGLGRRFRSLKLWFVLRSFGVEGFREHIRRVNLFRSTIIRRSIHKRYQPQGVRLNNQFVSLLRSSPRFEILTPPSLALTVFRLKASALDATSSPLPKVVLNDLNGLFFDRLSARNDILLTQTILNGVFCVRFAVGAERTRELHVEKAFEVVCQEGELAAIAYLERLGGDDVSGRREIREIREIRE
jgi:aromatic-L-amino-acid/L-tryptophan decarboxylase